MLVAHIPANGNAITADLDPRQVDLDALRRDVIHGRDQQRLAEPKHLVDGHHGPLVARRVHGRVPQQRPALLPVLHQQALPIGFQRLVQARVVRMVRERAGVGVRLRVHLGDVALVRPEGGAAERAQLAPPPQQRRRARDVADGGEGVGVAADVGVALREAAGADVQRAADGSAHAVFARRVDVLVADPEEVGVLQREGRGGPVEADGVVGQAEFLCDFAEELRPGRRVFVVEETRGDGAAGDADGGGDVEVLAEVLHSCGGVSVKGGGLLDEVG